MQELPFDFTPASLRGLPLFGALLGWLTLVQAPLLALPGVPPWGALACWVLGLVGGLPLVFAVGAGWLPLGAPPRRDANLVAVRPGARPRRWLMAHLDSKAQGHSMAGRLVAVWTAGLVLTGFSAAAVWRFTGALPLPVVILLSAAGLAGSAMAAQGGLRGTSPGARDNGSGIAAVLAAAGAGPDIGLVITGAEEFGLAGARHLAASRPELFAGSEVVNLDTIDQEGPLLVVSHDARGRDAAHALGARLSRLGIPVRFPRLPLAIFVDSAPLARLAPAVTVSRLTWATLRIIHTTRDTAAGFSLDTAERVGLALSSPD